MMSALFDAVVLARPAMKQTWYTKWPMAPSNARRGQSARATRGSPVAKSAAAKTADATPILRTLNAWGGISLIADLTTE